MLSCFFIIFLEYAHLRTIGHILLVGIPSVYVSRIISRRQMPVEGVGLEISTVTAFRALVTYSISRDNASSIILSQFVVGISCTVVQIYLNKF